MEPGEEQTRGVCPRRLRSAPVGTMVITVSGSSRGLGSRPFFSPADRSEFGLHVRPRLPLGPSKARCRALRGRFVDLARGDSCVLNVEGPVVSREFGDRTGKCAFGGPDCLEESSHFFQHRFCYPDGDCIAV